jgi:hypothetical protein
LTQVPIGVGSVTMALPPEPLVPWLEEPPAELPAVLPLFVPPVGHDV